MDDDNLGMTLFILILGAVIGGWYGKNVERREWRVRFVEIGCANYDKTGDWVMNKTCNGVEVK